VFIAGWTVWSDADMCSNIYISRT